MRIIRIVSLFVVLAAANATAQTVSCQLRQTQYVLRGACLIDPDAPRQERGLSAFWPSDSVRVLMTAAPWEDPPWRGNLSLPNLELSFEVAREQTAPDRSRVVLRTGLFWLLVSEWKQTGVDSALLAFGLTDAPSATRDDIAILDAAISNLDSIVTWDRADDRICTNDEPGAVSLFCVLYFAIEDRMGRYHHRQPALELLRAVIVEDWRDRMAGHPIMDFNNHADTTMDEVRRALQITLDLAREQATSEN